MIWMYIVLFLSYAIEPYIFFDASYRLLKPKCKRWVCFNWVFGGLYCIFCLKQYLMFTHHEMLAALGFLIVFLYYLFAITKTHKSDLKHQTTLFVQLFIMQLGVEMFVAAEVKLLFHYNPSRMNQLDWEYVYVTIISELTNLVIYRLVYLSMFIKKKVKLLKNEYTFIVFGNFVIILYMFIGLFLTRNSSENEVIIVLLSGTLLIFEISFGIFIMIERANDKRNISMANEKIRLMESQLSYAETMNELAQEMKKMRHDYLKHMNVIYRLAEYGKMNEIKSYLYEMDQDLAEIRDVVILEHPVICAVVTEMKQKARKNNIRCETCITVSKFPFNQYELSSLITNILQNAIEACCKIQDIQKRKIDFEIKYEHNDTIVINCKNTMTGEIIMNRKGKIQSTKEDKTSHGLGIEIIESIVKKYSGDIAIHYSDTNFYFNAWIPVKKEEAT